MQILNAHFFHRIFKHKIIPSKQIKIESIKIIIVLTHRIMSLFARIKNILLGYILNDVILII